jgi:hypothetical protein
MNKNMDELTYNKPEESKGALVGAVIIVLLLIVGGVYVLTSKNNASDQSDNTAATTTIVLATSTDLGSIDSDINAADPATLDKNLNTLDANLKI